MPATSRPYVHTESQLFRTRFFCIPILSKKELKAAMCAPWSGTHTRPCHRAFAQCSKDNEDGTLSEIASDGGYGAAFFIFACNCTCDRTVGWEPRQHRSIVQPEYPGAGGIQMLRTRLTASFGEPGSSHGPVLATSHIMIHWFLIHPWWSTILLVLLLSVNPLYLSFLRLDQIMVTSSRTVPQRRYFILI